MVVLNALMEQPVSLSSWGQFNVGRFPVEVKVCDYGLVQTPQGEYFLSVVFVGSQCRESRVYDRGLGRRFQADLVVLADMGLAVDTIDWSSFGDSDEDRARWRQANLGAF